jgi:serine/threonine-protein kinase
MRSPARETMAKVEDRMHIETLGRYRILREWGRSAVGRILLAHDPATDSEVAIQLVETLSGLSAAERDEAAERVRRDCGTLVGLEHPNLVAPLDVDEAEGIPYVVTERLEGTPFDVYCRPDSLLPTSTAVDLVAGVARGLDEMHRAGLVHGDVRPANLLRVADAGMVGGIGLASCLPRAEGAELRGAPPYLSPEQVRNEPLDGRSDLFSLGAVLYEMLTGAKAFPGESTSTVLYRIVNEDVRDPGELDPPVHASVEGVLRRALSKEKDERFESGASFAAALDEASIAVSVDESIAPEAASSAAADADSAATGAGTPRPAPPPPKAPSRLSARPFVLSASLVVIVAIAAVTVLRDRGDGTVADEPWLEAHVRTEPAGLEVRLDGERVDPAADGTIRFRGTAPFGVLSASHECRTAEHRLEPADAGGELVLVTDPVEVVVPVDPAVDGARVLVNGADAGTTPAEVTLDLCRTNELEVRAEGYRTSAIEVPAGAQPLEARKLVFALALEPIPRGRLVLPRKRGLQLVYYVDGKRIGTSVRELELEEGEHDLRLKNEYHWLDVTTRVRIESGATATPGVEARFATLAVQAFPSNCEVFLRRPGGRWKFLDETPAERRVATGRYEIKVQLKPTGESRVTTVELKEGANPPVRVAFGSER